MSRFPEIVDNIILRNPDDIYGRIYIVSAYSGITNELLEHKKTGNPGIYQLFREQQNYPRKLLDLRDNLFKLNEALAPVGLNLDEANDFIGDHIDLTINILRSMDNVLSSGYVSHKALLLAARELLASLGEMHSAFNSANILKNQGYNSTFVDLSGWEDSRQLTIDERIKDSFSSIDPFATICFATGYTKGKEGIMREFDRGYSEVTSRRWRSSSAPGRRSSIRSTTCAPGTRWSSARTRSTRSATPTSMWPTSWPTSAWRRSTPRHRSRSRSTTSRSG